MTSLDSFSSIMQASAALIAATSPIILAYINKRAQDAGKQTKIGNAMTNFPITTYSLIILISSTATWIGTRILYLKWLSNQKQEIIRLRSSQAELSDSVVKTNSGIMDQILREYNVPIVIVYPKPFFQGVPIVFPVLQQKVEVWNLHAFGIGDKDISIKLPNNCCITLYENVNFNMDARSPGGDFIKYPIYPANAPTEISKISEEFGNKASSMTVILSK